METENDDTSSCRSSTNWSVAGGALENRVTFESSLSPIDGESPNCTTGSSIILRPPSPDSGPCEITINFTQKHEVQQIYVRSTARVYEIYYAPDLQSENEYLCTVRCGIAARDEEVHSANSNGSLKEVSEENVRDANNLSTSEDDWVEVKVPDNRVLDKKISSSLSKSGSEQAFYEATAQMSDVNPCISLTLRLLSLERKDCVYVDEIYVFADPADSLDLENQESTVENSTGSSLMAMFMPTLLQLSKTRSVSQTQDSQMIGPKASDSTSVATGIQTYIRPSISDHEEVKMQDVNRATIGSTPSQIPLEVPVTESKIDTAYDHVERSMDLLVSRMGKIEDLLLRFEDKMVNPMSNIEARLERVEQQVEALSRQSHNSGLSTCSRFCAPSFSCIESDSNSFYNSINDCPSCEAVIRGNKDSQSESLPTPPYHMSDSVKPSKLVPGLVVTAPEFSSDDEDEEDESSGLVISSSRNKPRAALTVDDALASALAGFMSLTSNQPQKCAKPFWVKAPEFLNDEDDSPDTKASVRGEESGTGPSMCFDGSDGIQNVNDSLVHSTTVSSYTEENVEISSDEHSVKPDSIHVQYEHHEVVEKDQPDGNSGENEVDHGMDRTASCKTTEETENGVDITKISNIANPDKNGSPDRLPQNGTNEGFNNNQDDANTKELVEENSNIHAKEVTEENSDKDVLKNILGFSRASSEVDFGIPVLDVKFTSLDSCSGSLSLASLLSESPESMTEEPYLRESDHAPQVDEESSLIIVEDGEPVGPAIDGNVSVVMDFYSVAEPLSTWGANLQCETSNSHETFAASLI
ncbi:uncharacterized protein LOC126802228 [Argentina anserina]|uniref:uncharacterized protein LOC126802228 n=1 Tax=Argentina anserina TaxID=57926 RepID=UPI0021764C8F|nr:uncharacterized protein LOC126802228 [Potentilla anserina]